jgi:hypothetical protein
VVALRGKDIPAEVARNAAGRIKMTPWQRNPEGETNARRAFVEAVSRICLKAGGVLAKGETAATWEIDTKAGKVLVCPMADSASPWIACRFLEPNRVLGMVEDTDAYTGRWNFHLWADWKRAGSPEWEPAYSKALTYFESRLISILKEPK